MRSRWNFIRPGRALLCVAWILGYVCPALRAEDPPAVREARQLLRAQKFDEAAAKYAELVKSNRFDSWLWRDYGFSLHSGKKYEEARGAFLKAIELGNAPAANMYNIACGYALLGKTEEAVVWLRKALDAGFVEDETIQQDTDLDPIRNDPRFKAAVGFYPPENLSREEQWRYDLDFYMRRMEQMHWDLYAKVTKTAFQAAVQQLKNDAPKLTDDQVLARLRRITATVGDGHTILRRARADEKTVPRYPFDLYVFSDGLFVRSAPSELAQLVGGRVLRIGALDAAAALEAIKPYASVDNAMGYLDWASSLLASPAILEAIGAAPDTKSVSLTVQTPAGEAVTQTLAPVAFEASSHAAEPRFAIRGYHCANANAAAPLPLYLQKPEKNLWFEYLPERKLVYFYFGHVLDDPDETLARICERLFEFIAANPVERLVIDMRLNGGGNTGLVLPLIHGLIRCDKVNRDGGLFVIIGRRTFSAAMNTVSQIEMHTKATFVGEPTGSSPNFVGESTTFTLPCSKYVVSCSSRYWQHTSSTDKRVWIAPQIVAELSFKDYAENRDPALAAIFKALDERGPDVSRETDAAPIAATATQVDAAEPKFTPPPPAEETAEIKALIDKAEENLKASKTDVSGILTDAQYMPAHAWPRFRKTIEKYAAKAQVALVTRDEPGTPLVVTGTVRDRQGNPVKSALLYAYQTSAKGWYSDKAAHISGTAGDVKHARLFGFLKTGADGRYEIRTIRPAGYPGTDLPAHIHVEIEAGGKRGLGTEIRFDDDPRLTPAWRERTQREGFLVRLVRCDPDGTQRVEADFTLE